jgi:ribose/xylose/arabinose/galactoside ABC-type transport system permease subunit
MPRINRVGHAPNDATGGPEVQSARDSGSEALARGFAARWHNGVERLAASTSYATGKSVAKRYGTLIAFALTVGYFWVSQPGTFGTINNLKAILEQTAPVIVLGVGLTVVLVSGEFDLAFTGGLTVASLVAVKLMGEPGQGALVAVLAALGTGVLTGLAGGVLVATRRASSFIVTLAFASVLTGIANGVSNGQTITSVSAGFSDIANREILGIPIAVIIAFAVAAAIFTLLRWTVMGRYIEILGNNRAPAVTAGLRVRTIQVSAYACHGLCVGIAAVLLTSSVGQYTPNVGLGLLIPPYVAAFFGVSVLATGRFTVIGTVIGALFISTMQTGLIIQGVQSWVSDVVIGTVLIVILLVASTRHE